MSRLFTCLVLVALVLTCAVPATANDYLVGGLSSTPAVTHYRAVPRQVVAAAPVMAPSPCCNPAQVTAFSPVVAQPVTAYSPASPVFFAPASRMQPTAYIGAVAQPVPVTAWSPVVYAAPVAAAPVAVAPAGVARTKFYVPAQPIRNTFRWFSPGVPTPYVVAP